MEDDRRPVLRFLAFFEGIFAAARRFPLVSLRFAGLAGNDGDRIGDHEGRIEADTELADEVLIRIAAVLGFLQLFEEGLGPGLGDSAEVIHQILFIHAQAVVGNGQRMAVSIGRQVDFKARVPFEEIAVGQGLIMEFIDRIGGVGNQFPQEDFVICINRVDHEVQQLLRFSLKFMGFFCHGKTLLCIRFPYRQRQLRYFHITIIPQKVK